MQSDCQNYKMHVKLGTSIGWREIYKHISKGQHFLQSPHDLFLDTVFFALCIWLFYFYFYFSSSFFIFIFKNVKNTSALLFSHLYNENQQRSEKNWNDIEQGLHYQTTDNVPLLSRPFSPIFLPRSFGCWLPSHGCPGGSTPVQMVSRPPASPRPLDHIRALLSSSLQFTLATSG